MGNDLAVSPKLHRVEHQEVGQATDGVGGISIKMKTSSLTNLLLKPLFQSNSLLVSPKEPIHELKVTAPTNRARTVFIAVFLIFKSLICYQ